MELKFGMDSLVLESERTATIWKKSFTDWLSSPQVKDKISEANANLKF